MEYQVENEVNFYGVIKSVKSLVSLLKAINIKNVCSLFIHEDGFAFTVEQPRIVKVIIYIKQHHFFVYNIKDGYNFSSFGLPLEPLIDCLRLAIPSPLSSTNAIAPIDTNFDYCELTYDGIGSPFVLRRTTKDHSQKTNCDLIPFEPEEESVELSFHDTTQGTPQRIILKTKWLKRIFEDFSNTTEYLYITISPGETSLLIVAEGPDKTDEAELLKSSDQFESFGCEREVTFSYIFQHIMFCKKTLAISSEVSIDVFDSGALRMVFKISSLSHQPVVSGAEDYIEFSFLPSTSFT